MKPIGEAHFWALQELGMVLSRGDARGNEDARHDNRNYLHQGVHGQVSAAVPVASCGYSFRCRALTKINRSDTGDREFKLRPGEYWTVLNTPMLRPVEKK